MKRSLWNKIPQGEYPIIQLHYLADALPTIRSFIFSTISQCTSELEVFCMGAGKWHGDETYFWSIKISLHKSDKFLKSSYEDFTMLFIYSTLLSSKSKQLLKVETLFIGTSNW